MRKTLSFLQVILLLAVARRVLGADSNLRGSADESRSTALATTEQQQQQRREAAPRRLQSGLYSQEGPSFVGGDSARFGFSTHLSRDGTTLAVGAPGNPSVGYARVYKYLSNQWTLTDSSNLNGNFGPQLYGECVYLSDNGNLLAVGAPQQGNFGTVQIYEYASGSQSWVRNSDLSLGGTEISSNRQTDEAFGRSVALSGDGTRMVVGSPLYGLLRRGRVRIYRLSGNSWTIEQEIPGENSDDRFGHRVAMNPAGTVIVVGAYLNDGGGNNRGHARVYSFNGSTWNQVGGDIDGSAVNQEESGCVALSSDGNTVIVGAPYNSDTGAVTG